MSERSGVGLVTRQLDDLWFKLMAVVFHKFRDVMKGEVVITPQDLQNLIDAFPNQMPAMVVKGDGDNLILKLTTEAEGAKEQQAYRDKIFNRKRSKWLSSSKS